jgi:uroporphyrinogen III methyltransferase/synthase
LGRAGTNGDTAAFRVPAAEMPERVARLIEAGHDPASPAALIFNPGGAGQRKVIAPLRHLAGAAVKGLEGEVVMVVGPGVEAAERLDSLSGRPLHGRRVLVTRARHQAEEFHRHLADLGAWVIDIPTIEVRPTRLDARLRDAIDRLGETHLVVFASANAVEIFFDMLFELRRDARAFRNCRLCAIGPETARSLESHGLRPELVSGEYTAEGLAETLGNWDLTGARILVPRARQNRDGLPAILAKRGAEVDILPVYELAPPAAAPAALHRLLTDPVDVATFTSTATVVNFAAAFKDDELDSLLERTRIACMGPVTADTARRLGMRVDIIAGEYTTRGLAQAVASHFNR